MVVKFLAKLLRSLADHLTGDDSYETNLEAKSVSDTTLLALRLGRVEGRQNVQLAIESAILFFVGSATMTYIASVLAT